MLDQTTQYDTFHNDEAVSGSVVLIADDGIVPEVARSAPLQRQFYGIDVFVEWHGDVDELARTMQAATLVGDFRLSMISTRGTEMWPNGAKHADRALYWGCRFIVAEGALGAELEVPRLLSVIGERLHWIHVEKLHCLNDLPAQSRTKGENREHFPTGEENEMTMQTAIKPTGLAGRMNALRLRHRSLDDRVTAEHQRPRPDSALLQRLKRERLRLRDELARHEGLLRTVSRGRSHA